MTADTHEVLRSRQVAPSILSADFAKLGAQVADVLSAGARLIHVDVMDGHFVPPISFGAVAVQAIADQVHEAGGRVDVHLMIERPERTVSEYARAGADSITVHAEATPHLHYALSSVREAGCTAGAAINPATQAGALREVTEESVDLVLCMSVNPGWGNQRLIPGSYDKLKRLRAALPDQVALEVDGGVHQETVHRCTQAGANLLVAGAAIFGADDPGEAYAALVATAWPDTPDVNR